MKKKIEFRSNPELDDEIYHILECLKDLDPRDEEYGKAVANLRVLYETRAKRPALKIEIEPILAMLFQFGFGLVVLNHERLYVISSRIWGWIKPPKI